MLSGFSVREGLSEQRVGDELMIFDHVDDKVHVLNSSSSVIWEGIRAGESAEEVGRRLHDHFDMSGVADVQKIISDAVDTFEDRGLIVPAP